MSIKAAYLIDLIFLLLAPAHPSLLVIAMLQFVARRNTFICRGFASFSVVQVLPNTLQLILLPGLASDMEDDDIMSSGEDVGAELDAEPRTPRTEDMNLRSADRSAMFKSVQAFTERSEPAEIDPPNTDELRMLGLTIRYNAEGATKQQSIEMAFGVKKGGSAGWRRASQLFDQAMAPPTEPAVTPIAGRRTHARFTHVKES